MTDSTRTTNDTRAEVAKPKLKKPRMYKVVLVNDDYTPMEFVVELLQDQFGMPELLAINVMLQVHFAGRGVCGVFTREVAEMKVRYVLDIAAYHGHPLQCAMEPD